MEASTKVNNFIINSITIIAMLQQVVRTQHSRHLCFLSNHGPFCWVNIHVTSEQKNSNTLILLIHLPCFRSANTADEEKSAILVRQQEHLRLATVARSKYNSLSAAAKQTATANALAIGPHEPNSADISFHYSFDFAQQVIILLYNNNNNNEFISEKIHNYVCT